MYRKKFTLRISNDLHDLIKIIARRNHISMNELIIEMISDSIKNYYIWKELVCPIQNNSYIDYNTRN